MDAKKINQNFDLVNYISSLVQGREAGSYFIGSCPICGGRDRFNIKRTASGDIWICRKCQPDTYQSAIQFLMAYHQESFAEALKRASIAFGGPFREINGNRHQTHKASPLFQIVPSPAWRAKAWASVESAADRILSDAEGVQARQYLSARGLDRGSIFRNWLGCATVYQRPAIVIPWLDSGDVITAVKYRFIDQIARDDKSKRFSMLPGSIPYLFGLQHILESDTTLLFVEGELNAISIMQTLPRGVSIVSAGPDTNGNTTLLHVLARRYNRVIIWMDDPSKAHILRNRMACPTAFIIKSPTIEAVKYDANQMLQVGLLGTFIARQLFTVNNIDT